MSLGISISILQFGNILKYNDPSCSSSSIENGIVYQFIWVYTSQWNGVAIRKNHCYCSSIMFHMKVPKFYRGIILSACYLINRLYSSVVHKKILYYVLLLDHPKALNKFHLHYFCDFWNIIFNYNYLGTYPFPHWLNISIILLLCST